MVVIGSGPGGYVAAIKAAQLGMKVQETKNSWHKIVDIVFTPGTKKGTVTL